MTKKRFPLWLDDSEISKLKDKAKKQNRSVNSYVKNVLDKAEASPNLALGNWWDNPEALRKLIREARK